MRVIPFVLILFILLFGVVAALETFNSPTEEAGPPPPRPTVTPRPRPTSPRPEETPVVAAPTASAPAVAAQAAGPTPVPNPQAPTATPGVQAQMRVANTGGEGVYLRRTPKMDDRIRPWREGTQMMVLGQPTTVDGISWLKVRAPDGVEGYIPAQYLVR